jgi:hypothetical protein
MKNGQKLKLWDTHSPKEISKKYKHQSMGMPRGTPSSSAKSGHLSRHYIFIASCTMRFSWSVFTLVFSFLLLCLLQ